MLYDDRRINLLAIIGIILIRKNNMQRSLTLTLESSTLKHATTITTQQRTQHQQVDHHCTNTTTKKQDNTSRQLLNP